MERLAGRETIVARSVPWRSSLLARQLVTSVLVALCSVAASAWLAATTTTHAIQQQQAQALADDAAIYDTLLGYAAAHPAWADVTALVHRLAARTGQQITLTTQDGRVIATSSPVSPHLRGRPSAVIDPLNVDPAIATASSDGIDARAVGPFRLTTAEQARLISGARKSLACLRSIGWHGSTMTISPAGRPDINMMGSSSPIPMPNWTMICGVAAINSLTASETIAINQLNKLVDSCLARQRVPGVKLDPGFTWTGAGKIPDTAVVQSCIDTSRREQLRPYVAPAALLSVASPVGPSTSGFALTPGSRTRIIEATALVLALTIAITVFVSARLARPLRWLTEAVKQPTTPYVPVPVTTRDEIGYLTSAFNDLSARRERMEAQRKALLSDVAHELRTPLGNIRGWLEAAEDGLASPGQSLTSSLLEEARLLQRVIDDLQDLAAADAGRLHLHPEPVHLGDLLHQVAAAHQGSASATGVRLASRTEGDPELAADPARLRQAVGNLVSNAIRHTPAGGDVTMTGYSVQAEVLIEVADTGSGIVPADLPRVFDRFWRADKSRSRRTGGSGLGLPIARQIVEAHGGSVTVASEGGHGTVFTIRLPARAGLA
ncbi:MAG TPA: HAMP domain-containing sensor histidine kinase [Streptosporangiaceae bacterium]|nr:HAMP domain-containing sensor histidine kinase [Streptosporangiaceae bacterium]